MFYIYNGSEIDKVVNFLSNNGYNLSNFDNF